MKIRAVADMLDQPCLAVQTAFNACRSRRQSARFPQ